MHQFSFEKLEVWQLSRDFVKAIYLITKEFPDEEKYGLVSQIRRATISISANLAEGTSRKSYKDQARFSQIAYSSLLEVLNHLILSNDLDYLSHDNLKTLRNDIESIGNKINALHNYQTKQFNK